MAASRSDKNFGSEPPILYVVPIINYNEVPDATLMIIDETPDAKIMTSGDAPI